MFLWHGWTENCHSFGIASAFWAEAEARRFVGVITCGFDNSFNAGTCCPPAIDVADLDDVAYARAIVANISQHACIDDSHIYSAGFSNGAVLPRRMAVATSFTSSAPPQRPRHMLCDFTPRAPRR